MKTTFKIIALVLVTVQGQAQITASCSPEISCEIRYVKELPVPIAHSTCAGEILITHQDEKVSGGCVGTLIRTYHLSDDCGNVRDVQQIIHLKDTEPPQLTYLQPDIYLQSTDKVPGPPVVYARDNSGEDPPLQFKETKEENLIVRTWSAVDGCGNETTTVQKIHLAK